MTEPLPAAASSGFATRTLAASDLPQAWEVLGHAFGGAEAAEDRDVEMAVVDPRRFYATYDGTTAVASGGSFALTMTVPGGPRPVAGVTWVGVLPTHRRRGLLTALMRRLLDDLREAGEPVAALWASEGAIYQRFGYGPAAWNVGLSIPSQAAFSRPVHVGDLRLTEPVAAVLTPAYDRAAAARVGWTDRDRLWWAFRLHDPESRRSGASPLRAVVADGAEGVEGYALYTTRQNWADGGTGNRVTVREVVAPDPTTYARLWRYLLDLDLMRTVHVPMAATDDPLLHLLAEPRAARPVLKDDLWVRLVDLAAALSTRAYASELDVVLEVRDAFCPWNAGRWRLSADADGATCAPTSDPADLQLDTRDLGAAYLGGTALSARAGAGHVLELRAGALAAATTAFGWPGPAPHCPLVF